MWTITDRKTYSWTRNPHLTLPAQTMNQNGSWILIPERRSCCAHERCASSVIQLHRSRGLFSGDSVPLCCIPFKCLSCQQCHMSCCKLRFQREVCWKKGVEKRGDTYTLEGHLDEGSWQCTACFVLKVTHTLVHVLQLLGHWRRRLGLGPVAQELEQNMTDLKIRIDSTVSHKIAAAIKKRQAMKQTRTDKKCTEHNCTNMILPTLWQLEVARLTHAPPKTQNWAYSGPENRQTAIQV